METLELPATMAVDRKTTERLRQLAAVWQVTPEEALSRAVERADVAQTETPDPAAVLAAYHAKGGFSAEKAEAYLKGDDPVAMLRRLHDSGGGLDPAAAEAYLEEVAEDRKHWGER